MKRKKKPFFLRWWFILLVVVAAGIVVLIVAGNSVNGDGGTDEYAVDWSKMELGYLLPDPPADKGDIWENSDEKLQVTYDEGVSDDEYNDYLDACIEKGFTVDSVKDSSNYKAYNAKGYFLDLTHIDEDLYIELAAPMEFGTITWPKGIAGSILPAPKSKTGKFDYEYDDSFSVYIGDTPREDYDEYVDTCADAGFTADYEKSDDYYRAYNADGWYLSLTYKGNSIMYIEISPPDDFDPDEYEAGGEPEDTTESEDSAEPEDSTEPEDTAKKEETAEPDDAGEEGGLRPEFKEAMDSYENFMNEYVDFMKKYKENPDDLNYLSDYAKYMADYADAIENFDAWDGEDLNTEELQYYIEVQARVSQKLLDVGQ